MTLSERAVVLRDDPDFTDLETLMRFRLHYEGPLRSANGEPRDGQVDARGKHKHDIREAFHHQMRHLWQVNPFLANITGGYDLLGIPNPRPQETFAEKPSLRHVLAETHKIGAHSFVPLVCKEFSLFTKLEILMLRRDKPGGIIQARDIDNRLKVVFDALRMPKNGIELANCTIDPANDPMFVLLQDDSLISHVAVETDELLDPPAQAGNDDSFVRLLITVDIRPYQSSMLFTLGFAA